MAIDLAPQAQRVEYPIRGISGTQGALTPVTAWWAWWRRATSCGCRHCWGGWRPSPRSSP